MTLARHLEVDLTLLPTSQSGRRAPIFTGFRSRFHYDDQEWDVIHTLDLREFAFPGERATVYLTFRTPAAQTNRLHPGKRFEMREEGRVIGIGEVRKVLESVPESCDLGPASEDGAFLSCPEFARLRLPQAPY